jgi:hypothetical protein
MSAVPPLEKLCSAASEFYSRGDTSIVQLIRGAGLKDLNSSVTREAVGAVLSSNPQLIQSWLLWSMNKRVSKGWYFKETESGFEVGYYPPGPSQRFSDAITACADFIVREVTDIYAHHAL